MTGWTIEGRLYGFVTHTTHNGPETAPMVEALADDQLSRDGGTRITDWTRLPLDAWAIPTEDGGFEWTAIDQGRDPDGVQWSLTCRAMPPTTDP